MRSSTVHPGPAGVQYDFDSTSPSPNSTAGLSAHPPPSESSQAPSSSVSDMQQALLPKSARAYHHPISPARRRYTVVLVAVIAALLSADQNLLAPNLSAAAAYFGLDDFQKDTYLGGYLMAAFFLIGAPSALLCGYLTDKVNRVYMLAFIVVAGEAPCLCTYWVTELWQFFLVRMLTGISVGGCFPLVFSLLGDLFPVSQRAAMSAIVQIAVGGGIGGGQMVAGLLGPATNWRVPFVVMAAPTLALVLLLLLTVREPARGGFEKALEGQLAVGAAYDESISWAKVWRLLKVPSNWIIILQGIFGCLPWGVMQTYINDYLHTQKGLSIELATTVIMLFGVGCAIGVIAGGAAGQALYNWRRPSMAVLTGLSVLLGVGPVLYLINADIQAAGLGPALLMSALAGFLASIAGPNLRAIMINVNAPETRGVALALQSVTDDLGKGLGPVIVAGFISQLGRAGAFNLSVSAWVPCGIMLTCLALTMAKDEDTMQAHLAERSAQVLREVQVAPADEPPGPSDDPGDSSNSMSGLGFEPATDGSNDAYAGDHTMSPKAGNGHSGEQGGAVGGSEGPQTGTFKGLGQVVGQGRLAAAVGGVLGHRQGRPSVLIVVVQAGGVEMQQLLTASGQASSGSAHAQEQQQQQQQQEEQQRQLQQHWHAQAPAGQEQQQQQKWHHGELPQLHTLGLTGQQQQTQQHWQQLELGLPPRSITSDMSTSGGNSGSRTAAMHQHFGSIATSPQQQQYISISLQRQYRSQDCLAPASAPAPISAAGARHRTGHSTRHQHSSSSCSSTAAAAGQQEGYVYRKDSGGSSGSGSGAGGIVIALGEGVEESCGVCSWQSGAGGGGAAAVHQGVTA